MKLHQYLIALLLATAGIKAMDPVTMGLIAKMMPQNLAINLDFDFQNQNMNQTCYGNIDSPVYNDGGTVQIIFGSCTNTAGQQIGGMGKIGDITVIPYDQLTLIKNFGTLSEAATKLATIPNISSGSNSWNNAIYIKFKASDLFSPQWAARGAGKAMLNKIENIVTVRTLALTEALAQKEGHVAAYEKLKDKNPILVEVWAQSIPSITGSNKARQIFNFVVSGDAIGKPLGFIADQAGNAAIAYKIRDIRNVIGLATNSFNVNAENP
jgi:hypothetical protein